MLLRIVVWLILGFLLAPLILIVLFSFHSSPALSFPFQGFSLRWYEDLWNNKELGRALVNSLNIAFFTALVSGPSSHTISPPLSRNRPTRSAAERSSWHATVTRGRPRSCAIASTKRVFPQPVGPLSRTGRRDE